MEYITPASRREIEVAAEYGVGRAHIGAYRGLAEQSGLSFAEVCALAAEGRLGVAVDRVEIRKAHRPRIDPRRRLLELRRRARFEPAAEPSGPFWRHVPVRS